MRRGVTCFVVFKEKSLASALPAFVSIQRVRRDAREEKRRENFFSKTKQEREREKRKKRTLQHPRMAFTVFHHPSVRVPVRLERSHAVIVIGSVVHRAVSSSSSSSLHIFLVFFFSVGQFDDPFHVSRRHRRVFKPLSYPSSSYFSKRDKKKELAGSERKEKRFARSKPREVEVNQRAKPIDRGDDVSKHHFLHRMRAERRSNALREGGETRANSLAWGRKKPHHFVKIYEFEWTGAVFSSSLFYAGVIFL